MKHKHILLKSIFLLIFMLFICTTTFNLLYENIKLTNEEYINLLLSDSYENNLYYKLINLFRINPINFIEIDSKYLDLNNNDALNPYIYIYNSEPLNAYKDEFNIKPNVMMTSYILTMKLNELGISTIRESTNINDFSMLNNMNNVDTINVLSDYDSTKYYINIDRSDYGRDIYINGKLYSVINFYVNKDNVDLVKKINLNLNSNYNGISKIYLSDNDDFKIEIGNKNSNMNNIVNSVDALSKSIYEVIYDI